MIPFRVRADADKRLRALLLWVPPDGPAAAASVQSWRLVLQAPSRARSAADGLRSGQYRRCVPEASGPKQCRNWPHPKLFLESVQSPLTTAFRIAIATIKIHISKLVIESTVCSYLISALCFFILPPGRPGTAAMEQNERRLLCIGSSLSCHDQVHRHQWPWDWYYSFTLTSTALRSSSDILCMVELLRRTTTTSTSELPGSLPITRQLDGCCCG